MMENLPYFFHVVLYQPEIPENTGAIGRTCVGVGAKLWLVRPLGFQIDQRRLKRAGLDYWPNLNWEIVDDWNHLLRRIAEENRTTPPSGTQTPEVPSPAVANGNTKGASPAAASETPHHTPGTQTPEVPSPAAARGLPGRFWFMTKRGAADYTQMELRRGDVFVFGSESTGLPGELTETYADRCLKIPIQPGIRCLNLSVSVGVTLFEARRQLYKA